MTDCRHEFEYPDSTLVEQISNAGVGTERGLPTHLTVGMRCEKCGELVDVEYTLAFIDGGRPH